MEDDLRRRVGAIYRIEAPKLVARLARLIGQVGLAEELAHDALVEALEHWSADTLPENPGAWLMATAKRKALDRMRRARVRERESAAVSADVELWREVSQPDLERDLDDDIGDELLRLMFVSCHPVLSKEARVTLTLRLVGGLTTAEIARAFLVPEPTIAQRVVRAKRALADAKVPFEVPRRAELPERLASVLEVLYFVFNEGYTATSGEDWMRPALTEDALRLGRVLASLVPDDSEVLGLVALMELQASRIGARTARDGTPILLLDQERSRWDRLLIERGLAGLDRAERIAGNERGPYHLQAAIAACHARARTPEATDWSRIAALYTALANVLPSPVVELNRAVALSMAFGPEVGLAHVDALAEEPSLANYHLLPSVRGELLAKLGRFGEAARECARAAALSENARERALLERRAADYARRAAS
ncbi:MAG: RNA polymerase sigma factor [Polyangiaceae bacterium]